MKKTAVFLILAVCLLLTFGVRAATNTAVKPAAPAVKKVAAAKVVVPKDLGAKGIKQAAADFISKYLVGESTKVEVVVAAKKVDGLYALTIKLDGREAAQSAMSPDGQRFYPQVMDVAKVKKDAAATKNTNTAGATAAASVSVKNDRPQVELFVMSYCPYGTQIEKGLLPVLAAVGAKIDWQIKFVDYAMHGDKEITENLRQYCIQSNEPSKYAAYLSCFLEVADATGCLATAKIDQTKLAACTIATDQQYGLTAAAADKSKWSGSFPPFNIQQADNNKYGVRGSPTLVINGQQISGSRDSASLLATICSAFKTPPAECALTLSNQTPAPGFGSGTTNSTAAAGCGQ